MRRTRSVASLGLLVALVAAACGSGAPAPTPTPAATPGGATLYPLIVSTQQVVGENRFLFSLLTRDGNRPAAAPDRTVAVAFAPPGSTTASDPVDAEFLWAIENERGVYVLRVTFEAPGTWTAVFITNAPGTTEERLAVQFDVAADGYARAVGERAPASDTPTAADVGGDLRRLSTDTAPDPRFYEVSVADAVAAGEPFVLAFATPAFCQTAQCGPTLDRVKRIAPDYPEVTFINVEPYKLVYTEGRLQPELDAQNRLVPVPSVLEWGILTEPWIYIVDGEGVVRGSFEGIVGEEELRAVLDAIAG